MPNQHFILCLRVWNVTTVFCSNDAQVRLTSTSGTFVCSSLLPHVNWVLHLSIGLVPVAATLFIGEGRVSSLPPVFRSSFTAKTFQDSQTANSRPQRCTYFCRRHLLQNIRPRWLAVFGNHSLGCLWCFAASVQVKHHVLFHACFSSHGTAFWIYISADLNYDQVCQTHQFTV